jgi:UDP-N-acetylmuramate dehydrogenase
MDERVKKELSAIVEGCIEFDCLMHKHTTLQVGGKAEAVCLVKGLPELRELLSYLRAERIPAMVIGNGSNLLVSDDGFRGVMIHLSGDLSLIERSNQDKTMLFAGGGVPLVHLLHFCQKEGIGGLEFLAGIPGTVGGAIVTNAGAWGREMAGVVEEIELVSTEGNLIHEDRSGLDFSYRRLSLPPGSVIVRAGLRVREENPVKISSMVSFYLNEKKATQPVECPSAGSVFKNPPNDYAGRLIESAGLKGTRVGGAMISEKHANFIVNAGGAKAADILTLMALAKKRVLEKTGIDLELEIIIVGT